MAQTIRNLSIVNDHSYALDVASTDWVDARVLAASTAEAHTVPTQGGKTAKFVVFSSTDNFYAKYNKTAAAAVATVPGDTTDGTAAELNPTIRYLNDVVEISLVSAATPVVTMRFYF